MINAKQKKSADELRDLIAQRLGMGGVFISVNPDPAYGWHATVMTAPAQAIGCQQAVERIAADLRLSYDLKE